MAKSALKKLGNGTPINDYSDEEDGLTEVRRKIPVNSTHDRQPWKKLFLDFIGKLRVQTKDYGEIPLADNLYGAQLRFLDELCEGLETGQRHFVCLKARQLGISTISLALDLFWLAIHPGMQGALITDTASNKEKFRVIIDQYLSSLPKALKIKYDTSNRDMLVFSNGSVLDYLVAGVRSKRNGGLGRSRAYNFIHATECSSWGDAEGVASLMASLSEHHKDRLYIFESTARGFNLFHDMWQSAERDPETQRGIFIGWWAKESYTVDVKSELFRKYWDGILNVEEQEIADICEERYGVKIRPDQWAWYRWKSETRMSGEGTMQSEYPSHEREAFVATGRGFFPVKQVSFDLAALLDSPPVLEGYIYHMGEEFIQTQVEQVYSAGKADLKVWEYPNEKAQYVMGIDVAYGRDEDNDRSCIQVFRCYADRLIQVAEYASPVTETHHLAWIICHLGGNYKNCMINMEVQGPGYAVKQELDHLKQMLGQGMLERDFVKQPGLRDFFSKARYYLYHRPDSIGAGYVYFWKCLALDTKLPTPSGWTTMGEVQPGDYLLDETGNPCRVTGASPVQIGNKCYKITFDGDTSIVADENHLWKVYRNHWRGVDKIRKTSQLMARKFSVRKAAALKLKERNLPIPPYVLGVWLGDGLSCGGRYFSSQDDVTEMGENLTKAGAVLGKVSKNKTCFSQNIEGLNILLKQNGLRNNKHIPSAYLRASFEQRLELLQGLMDTDGSTSGVHGRSCEFTTTLPALAEGFNELLRSLGMKARCHTRNRVLQYAGGESVCSPAYQYSFTDNPEMPIFKLRRKLDKIKPAYAAKRRGIHHFITGAEEVKSVPVRCVQVDSPSHLYLAGDAMIPTHNTSSENKQTIFNQYRDCYMTKQLQIKSRLLFEEMQTIVQDGFEICGSGRNKDDRCMATALAVKAWMEWMRQPLINQKRTFDNVMQAEEKSRTPYAGFVHSIYEDFMLKQQAARKTRELHEAWDEEGDLGHEDAGFETGYEPSDDADEVYG